MGRQQVRKQALFKASYDKTNKQQVTNTVKLNGASSAEVNIPLASNVTIHIAGTSATQTGGTAKSIADKAFISQHHVKIHHQIL